MKYTMNLHKICILLSGYDQLYIASFDTTVLPHSVI
jgi:hypothetical protein